VAACAKGAGEGVFVGLGSNLGDRASKLEFARRALARSAGISVVSSSRIYETDPVGPPPQGPYLNAVLGLETALAPRTLLDRLLEIELAAGRVRDDASRPRWSARPLDLDLLLYGERLIDEPGLSVPHPRLHERAFVLEPLAELASERVHPVLGVEIGELAAALHDPSAVRVWRGGSSDAARSPC